MAPPPEDSPGIIACWHASMASETFPWMKVFLALLGFTSIVVVPPAVGMGSFAMGGLEQPNEGWVDAMGGLIFGLLGFAFCILASTAMLLAVRGLAWLLGAILRRAAAAPTPPASIPRTLPVVSSAVWFAVYTLVILSIGVLAATLYYEDPWGGRGYILAGLRSSGVLQGEAQDLWCRGAIDHVNTDGCATFVLTAEAIPEVERVARVWLESPPGTEVPGDLLTRAHQTAARFEMPGRSRLLEPTGLTVIPGSGVLTKFWEDLVVLSPDTGRVWHFRFNHMD